MSTSKKSLLRDPFIQFLILGALVFSVFSFYTGGDGSDKLVVVSATDVARLHSQWTTQYSKQPTPEQLQAIVDQHIRDEILYREARKLNLGEDDIIVRRRMVQKYLFLSESLSAIEDPSEQELEAFYNSNLQQYTIPQKYSFRHVYFRHSDGAKSRAEALLESTSFKESSDQWRSLGDAFMLQREYAVRDKLEIEELFGRQFAETITELKAGEWITPVQSAYGWHAVKILAKTPERVQPLKDIRDQVVSDYIADNRDRENKQYLKSLQEQYTVVVEPYENNLPAAETTR